MLRNLIVAAVLAALPSLAGCAVKEYDPKHPEEYSNYWKDEDHRRDSPAYPFTTDRERDRKGPYGP